MSMVNFCVPLFMARAYNVRVCACVCARACIIYMYVYRAAREKKSTAFTTVFLNVEFILWTDGLMDPFFSTPKTTPYRPSSSFSFRVTSKQNHRRKRKEKKRR